MIIAFLQISIRKTIHLNTEKHVDDNSDNNNNPNCLGKNIGTQSVQELFFVNKKPLEVANGAYQSIVKPEVFPTIFFFLLC